MLLPPMPVSIARYLSRVPFHGPARPARPVGGPKHAGDGQPGRHTATGRAWPRDLSMKAVRRPSSAARKSPYMPVNRSACSACCHPAVSGARAAAPPCHRRPAPLRVTAAQRHRDLRVSAQPRACDADTGALETRGCSRGDAHPLKMPRRLVGRLPPRHAERPVYSLTRIGPVLGSLTP